MRYSCRIELVEHLAAFLLEDCCSGVAEGDGKASP
jgi:hypothetical protein